MILFASFDKKYPLLDKYILDETTRDNMLKNKDLLRKYDACEDSIRIFLYEVEKRFDNETIIKFVKNVILKLPDNVLLSFITSYLESDETVKSNSDVYEYYKKISQFGVDAIKYIENNGIIADASYKELPNILKTLNGSYVSDEDKIEIAKLNEMYRSFDTSDIIFHEMDLDDVYYKAKLNEKKLIVNLLQNNSFSLFEKLFLNINYKFDSLILVLSKLGIDGDIINPSYLENLSEYYLMIIVYKLIDLYDIDVVNNIKYLFTTGKILLVKEILENDYIDFVGGFTKVQMDNFSNDEILKNLQMRKCLKREA